MPDAWPLGVSALTGGEHFIFAEDAAALGLHEHVQPPFDDRRLTDRISVPSMYGSAIRAVRKRRHLQAMRSRSGSPLSTISALPGTAWC